MKRCGKYLVYGVLSKTKDYKINLNQLRIFLFFVAIPKPMVLLWWLLDISTIESDHLCLEINCFNWLLLEVIYSEWIWILIHFLCLFFCFSWCCLIVTILVCVIWRNRAEFHVKWPVFGKIDVLYCKYKPF